MKFNVLLFLHRNETTKRIRRMGNSADKRLQAMIHNNKRKADIKRKTEREADMKANPEKYARKTSARTKMKAQAFIATALAMGASI